MFTTFGITFLGHWLNSVSSYDDLILKPLIGCILHDSIDMSVKGLVIAWGFSFLGAYSQLEEGVALADNYTS